MSTGTASPRSSPSGYKVRQVSNFSPEQMNLFQTLLGGLTGGGGLGGGLDFLSKLASGDESAFGEAEAPAYSAFNKMLGQVGSRYSQLGARDSSSFQQAVSGGAANLAEDLQSKRLGMREGAIERLLGLSQNLLGQKPFENMLEEKGGFDWGSLLGSLGGAAGGAFLGPVGSGLGSAVLPKLLKLFGLGG
jgi:hypothetical protein